MSAWNDPTVLHEADCRRCGRTVHDHELLDDGLCYSCQTDVADDDDDEADDGTIAARACELLANAREHAAARRTDLIAAIFDIARGPYL